MDTILSLNLGMICDMCYMFSHCIYFFVYLYCPVEPSVAINTWAIGWYVGICLSIEHLSLKTSNGLSVAINIQDNRLSVAKSTV